MLDGCRQNLYRQHVAPVGSERYCLRSPRPGHPPRGATPATPPRRARGRPAACDGSRQSHDHRRPRAMMSLRRRHTPGCRRDLHRDHHPDPRRVRQQRRRPSHVPLARRSVGDPVTWTRTGDDVSGSLSAAQVTQPQAQTELFSNAPAPGQFQQQTAAFTGTVRDTASGCCSDPARIPTAETTARTATRSSSRFPKTGRAHPAPKARQRRRLPQGCPADPRPRAAAQGSRQGGAGAQAARRQDRDHARRDPVSEGAEPRQPRRPVLVRDVEGQAEPPGFDFGSGRPTCTKAIRDSDGTYETLVSDQLHEPVTDGLVRSAALVGAYPATKVQVGLCDPETSQTHTLTADLWRRRFGWEPTTCTRRHRTSWHPT
jgi:hypothetical protein